MTRINCIPIDELTRQHCFAKYRELPHIRYAWPRREYPNIPKYYCLGKGHCTFFYDKGLWLLKRHKALYKQLINYWNYNIQKNPNYRLIPLAATCYERLDSEYCGHAIKS